VVNLLWLGPVWAFAMGSMIVVAVKTRGCGGRGGDVATHSWVSSRSDWVESYVTYHWFSYNSLNF